MENKLHCLKAVIFGASLTGIGIAIFNACGPKSPTSTTAAASSGTNANNGLAVSGVGTVTNVGFYVAIPSSLPGNYRIHAYDTQTTSDPTLTSAAFATQCTIPPSAVNQSSIAQTSNADIKCVVEGGELDLWYNGMQLNYNVPSGMCAYFTVTPYYYYLAPPGPGPTSISYQINLDGSISFQKANGVATTQLNPDTQIPNCVYTYNVFGTPMNCCYGTYTAAITTVIPNPTSSAVPPPPYTPSPTYTTLHWGGSPANCLGGPAVGFGNSNGVNGYPEGSIALTATTGTNGVLSVTAPITKKYLSSIYVANSYTYGNSLPTAMGAQPDGSPATNPYYEFTCLDRAFDILARIRVQVREWNDINQLNQALQGKPNNGPSTGGNGLLFNGTLFSGTNSYFTPAPNTTYDDPTFSENPVNKLLNWDDLMYWSTQSVGAKSSGTAANAYPYPGAAYPIFNQ